MKRLFCLLALVFLTVKCQVAPAYRAGQSERVNDADNPGCCFYAEETEKNLVDCFAQTENPITLPVSKTIKSYNCMPGIRAGLWDGTDTTKPPTKVTSCDGADIKTVDIHTQAVFVIACEPACCFFSEDQVPFCFREGDLKPTPKFLGAITDALGKFSSGHCKPGYTAKIVKSSGSNFEIACGAEAPQIGDSFKDIVITTCTSTQAPAAAKAVSDDLDPVYYPQYQAVSDEMAHLQNADYQSVFNELQAISDVMSQFQAVSDELSQLQQSQENTAQYQAVSDEYQAYQSFSDEMAQLQQSQNTAQYQAVSDEFAELTEEQLNTLLYLQQAASQANSEEEYTYYGYRRPRYHDYYPESQLQQVTPTPLQEPLQPVQTQAGLSQIQSFVDASGSSGIIVSSLVVLFGVLMLVLA